MPKREAREGCNQHEVEGIDWLQGEVGDQQAHEGRLCSHNRRECWPVASIMLCQEKRRFVVSCV